MARNGLHWPIPKTIDLGFHLVNVELWTKTRMRRELEEDQDSALDDKTSEFPEGWWDAETDLIVIGKWLPRMRQRWILCHELGHACLDLRDRYDRSR